MTHYPRIAKLFPNLCARNVLDHRFQTRSAHNPQRRVNDIERRRRGCAQALRENSAGERRARRG